MDSWRFINFSKILGIVTIMLLALPMSSAFSATQVWYGQPGAVAPVQHTFTLNDVQGGFGDGITEDDYENNPGILCGSDQANPCPLELEAPKLIPGVTEFYGLDNEFGFDVFDFAGATGLEHVVGDASAYDWAEGWVGVINDPDEGLGLALGNTDTKLFKSDAKRGTWCAGMGGTSVKCSTESYVVMENVLTCNETNPWNLALTDPPYTQATLTDPNVEPPLNFSCADAKLDNTLFEVVDGVIDELNPATALVPDADGLPDLPANESTIRNDVAVGDDYAITRKDDGKPLYRWGNLVKRPTDIRVYKSIPLPDAWKTGAVYPVTKAELKIKHWITNNPNDQIRAEDMENEGATGLKPEIKESVDSPVWTSSRDCYAGDGSLIPEDTVLKNEAYAALLDPNDPNDPYPYSSDLKGGFTHAYYATTDREPFEWWYKDAAGNSYSFPDPNEASAAALINDVGNPLTLVSGPRWRLKAPKYGQDLPGVEIGVDEGYDPITMTAPPGARPGCQPTPIISSLLKYHRGDVVTTVINLLDWNTAEGPSPLATTAGWVDARNNVNAIVADPNNHLEPYADGEEPATGISVNGAPLTQDFDLVVYSKGDKKPTVIYNAELYVEWDDTAIVLWEVAGVGDFDADGLSDALIRSDDGSLLFLEADGTVNAIGALSTDWSVEGVGDFDNDGFSDVLVRNGKLVHYIEADGSPIVYKYNLHLKYEVEGIGDFDGNGKSDVLILNTVDNTIWYMAKAGGTPILLKWLDPAMSIVGVGEFLVADGTAEVLIRNNTAGGMYVLPAPRTPWVLYKALAPAMSVEGVGDINADGVSDVLVRDNTSSALSYISAAGGALNPFGSPDPGDQVEGVGLFNAGANADVLLQSGTSLYYMQEGGTTTAISTSSL